MDNQSPLSVDLDGGETGQAGPGGIRRTDANWATPVERLSVDGLPSGAVNLNVEGRLLTGPLQGFGQLWKKTYKIRLGEADVSPAEVVKVWKEQFASFWPPGNRFFGSMCGIVPGETVVLNLAGPGGITAPGGMPLISTGILVVYADQESFSFMTPQGHMFAAMITFSAYEDDGTVAQVQALIRAGDPIYELSLRMGFGHRSEDEFWQQTLKNLAAHFQVNGYVEQNIACLDPRLQWAEAKNIWHNALIRTVIYNLLLPVRRLGRLFKPRSGPGRTGSQR